MLDTVKKLCALSGVSGWEDDVRDYILERALPYADETSTDPMGNLFIFKKGAVTPEAPVMFCALPTFVMAVKTRRWRSDICLKSIS